MRGLNSWFAQAMNCLLSRNDKFWTGKEYQPLFPQEAVDIERAARVPHRESAGRKPGRVPSGLPALSDAAR